MFPGRQTRHATDPVNSALNYVYSMLYGAVWRSLLRAGLDPYFGIMHGSQRDQGSLVFDIIEEFRASFADRVVVGMLGRGFDLEFDADGRLRSECRRKLVSAFHKQGHRAMRPRRQMRAPSDILDAQATCLRNTFLRNDEYRPFRLQWQAAKNSAASREVSYPEIAARNRQCLISRPANAGPDVVWVRLGETIFDMR